MKQILIFTLCFNCFQLFSQKELIVWKRDLVDSYDSKLEIDTIILGKDTSDLKEIMMMYRNSFLYETGKSYTSNNKVLLIYYGDSIIEPYQFKLPYNPLSNFIEMDKIMNKYLGECIPVYDDLPDGLWIALKFSRELGVILSSEKEVKKGKLSGCLNNFDSNGKLRNRKKYKHGYITEDKNLNSNSLDSIVNVFDKCGKLRSSKTYQNKKLTFLKEEGEFPFEIYLDEFGQVISIEFENGSNKLYLEFEDNLLSERIEERDIKIKMLRNEVYRRGCNKYRIANNVPWGIDLKKGMTEVEFFNFIISSEYAHEVIKELNLINIRFSKEELYPRTPQRH